MLKSEAAKITIIITSILIIIIWTRRKGGEGGSPDLPPSSSQTSSLILSLLLFAPGGRVGKGEARGEVVEQLLLSRPSLSPTAVFTGQLAIISDDYADYADYVVSCSHKRQPLQVSWRSEVICWLQNWCLVLHHLPCQFFSLHLLIYRKSKIHYGSKTMLNFWPWY